MKKGYITGMVAAVLVITIGIFTLSDKENANKSVNGVDITTKIEEAAKTVNSYYGEIKVAGAVGNKKGAYLVKQWYKTGRLYSENYINNSSNKKQQLQKTSVTLRENDQTTIYNLDSKNAIVTKTSTDKSFPAQEGNFLQFPLGIIKNGKSSKNVTLNNNEYIFDINKDNYQYKVKYDKDTLLPIKVEISYQGKFSSSIQFVKLEINKEIKENQFTIKMPSNTKILKRSYSNESSNLTKIRSQVKFPILQPSFLPKGIVLDKVTKEVIDTVEIVNITYKGAEKIYIIESIANKFDDKTIPSSLKKVNVGKYQGYQSKNGNNLVISWQQDKTSITIYGDIDNNTLLKIAASFK